MSTNPLAGVAGALGSATAEAAAFAGGLAIGPTLRPVIQFLENGAWKEYPDKPIPAETAAEVAAEDVNTYPDMQAEAQLTGFNSDRFASLYGVTLTAPGVGELLNTLRRQTIGRDDFTHGLRKAKLEARWDAALADLANVYLSPDILAVMLQRSVIPNQGQLPGVQLDTTGRVPRFPQVDIDAYAMAKTFGWDGAQLDAQTRIQGLPPGMDLVARMVFRQILDRGDFNLAAEQSNRRVEWADYEFDGYRQIPTAHDFVENRLRGWTPDAAMYAGTALHGMTTTDTDVLLQNMGRPLSWHQVFIGLRRGGEYNGPTGAIAPAFLRSLQESDIRPEWYDLAWAQRYSYPSAFVLRSLTQDGDITEAEAEQILLFEGWEPTLAATVAGKWAGGKGAAADPHVTKAQNQLWTTTHASYKAGELDDQAATTALGAAGVGAAAVPAVLDVWKAERNLVRHGLTIANYHKAYTKGDTNDATGQPWTRDETIAELVRLGYNPTEAGQYLDIP